MKDHTCCECGFATGSILSLSRHISQAHFSIQEYYDTHLKKNSDGICLICESPTPFRSLRGYSECCSRSCSAIFMRKKLKEDKPKFNEFKNKVKSNQSKIWESRTLEEKNTIHRKSGESIRKFAASLTDEERALKYGHEVSELSVQALMKCVTQNKSGYRINMKGRFKPKNPQKYKGDPTNIIYRSSYELKLMQFLDTRDEIVQWASEEFIIPYRSPVDSRIHRYYPDFWVKKEDGTVIVIEVKPAIQTKEPKKPSRVTKKYINEVMTYGVNQAKWKAAREFCADRKWQFQIFTETELGIK